MFSEVSAVKEPILVHLACSGIKKIQAGYESNHTSLNREDMLNFVLGWKWISGLMTDLNPSDTCNTSMDIFEYVCNNEFKPDTNPSDRIWLAQKHKIEEFAILIMSIMYKRNCIDQFLFRSIINLLSWNINYQNLNQNNSDHEISNKTWNKLLLQILNISDGQTKTSNCLVNVRDGQTKTSNCVVNVHDGQVDASISHTKINSNISYNQSETTIYNEDTENSIKTEKIGYSIIDKDIRNINGSKEMEDSIRSKKMEDSIKSKEIKNSIKSNEIKNSIWSKEIKNSIWSKECKLVSLSEDVENIIFQNSINYILVIILNNNKIKSRMNKITKILSQNLVSIGSLIPLTYDSLILKQEYEEYEEYNRLTQEMKKYDMIIPSNNTNFERITPEIISSKLDIMKKTNISTKQKIIILN